MSCRSCPEIRNRTSELQQTGSDTEAGNSGQISESSTPAGPGTETEKSPSETKVSSAPTVPIHPFSKGADSKPAKEAPEKRRDQRRFCYGP